MQKFLVVSLDDCWILIIGMHSKRLDVLSLCVGDGQQSSRRQVLLWVGLNQRQMEQVLIQTPVRIGDSHAWFLASKAGVLLVPSIGCCWLVAPLSGTDLVPVTLVLHDGDHWAWNLLANVLLETHCVFRLQDVEVQRLLVHFAV